LTRRLTPLPYTTLFRSQLDYTGRRQLRSDLYRWVPGGVWRRETHGARLTQPAGRSVAIELRPGANRPTVPAPADPGRGEGEGAEDRKSTRLNSSHGSIA